MNKHSRLKPRFVNPFMKKYFFLLLPFFAAVADEQTVTYFADTISTENLEKHLSFLASDSLRGRLTGSKEQKIAAVYLAKFFQENGLKAIVAQNTSDSSFFQSFYIKKYFGGQHSIMLNPTNKMSRAKNVIATENVIGFLEGTDKKEEVLVISAHYDHIGTKNGTVFNGADDDGSGTVAMMEMARVFSEAKKQGKSPRRSILFIAFAGEEYGLLGSEYYTEKPVIPLKNTICDLNIDMIGRIDELHANQKNYVYLIGSDKISQELHALSERNNALFTNLKLDYSYNSESHPQQLYYRSDHYNFAKNKIPIIFYFDGEHPDYHQSTDDVDRIDFELLKKRTQLVFYTAWDIANREGTLN